MPWYAKLVTALPYAGICLLALHLAIYAWKEHREARKHARSPEPEDIIDTDPEYFSFAAGLIANDLEVEWQSEEVYRLHRVYLRGLGEVALLREQKSISGELSE